MMVGTAARARVAETRDEGHIAAEAVKNTF